MEALYKHRGLVPVIPIQVGPSTPYMDISPEWFSRTGTFPANTWVI